MARLPVPGEDNGVWGTVLNEYLAVAHNDDGTLKNAGVLASKANDADVVHLANNESVSGVKTFIAPPAVPAPVAGGDAANKAYVDSQVPASSTLVHTTGDESVAGVKTFTASPVVPTPAQPDQAANKAYVDSLVTNKPWQFNVKSAPYNAVGDSTTNDTAAIQAAIDAATAYAVANNGYAEVIFPPATYALTSAARTDRSGNAQLALPVIAGTANKVTLALVGVADAASMPHWNATSPQVNGVVLKSTWNSPDLSATSNEGSVLGGPTLPNGYVSGAVYSNCNIVIKGIQIQVPFTSRGSDTSGIDLRGVANAHLEDVAFYPNATPNQLNGTYSMPGWSFGIAMPVPGNNDLSVMNNCSVEGATYGFYLGEHLSADRLAAIYCYTGMLNGGFFSSVGQQHYNWIGGASIEACVNGVHTVASGKIVINALSVEGSMNHVVDSTGNAVGSIGLGGIISTINVSDPTGIKVTYLDRKPGAVTAPTVPASTTAFRNPFWRDIAVQVNNGTGTVSNVTVDGVSILSGPGMVIVPSGKKITLTYSGGTPTWTWMAL